jgi:hypothetical protein
MTRVSAIIMIVYLALSLAVGFFSCCCSCLTGAFRTGDEENLQYTGYQQVRLSCLQPADEAHTGSRHRGYGLILHQPLCEDHWSRVNLLQ